MIIHIIMFTIITTVTTIVIVSSSITISTVVMHSKKAAQLQADAEDCVLTLVLVRGPWDSGLRFRV